ncbi:LysR family transcriptional activator of glutamate synthase operon [Gracilibacillus halotolerans]|uniref:LysR family transcriptional activator of glutamate synthase operon n=1 Tax=Gracilibacillus halotolerans TaxID=74386 RepID=A0A841RG26_9BACI|nr:LysR family transcriptional regulator [Gracilibacillus halotolerans]MBB6511561.1 LysR family transcriptional activator of glutamate synthase operon [Gracilibacillus halotolerans]
MELRQLRYFVEVAEREHVSAAAAELHVAQSALSRQIANLEAELGVDLFEREGRNIRLTQIGRIFLTHTKSALKAIDYATKQVDEYIDPERGSIKIGFPTSLASNLLPTVVSEFKKLYPKVGFQLRQGSYNFLIEAVENRDIDIAFLGPVPQDQTNIIGNVLFTEKFYALVPSSHHLANKESIDLIELKDEPFVLFPKGYILHKLVFDGCSQAGFEPKASSEGEDLDAIKGLVAAGIGITMLPESAFSDLQSLNSSKIPIKNPIIDRTVGVIIPRNRKLAPSEQVFYNFIIDFFKYAKGK